MLIQETQYVLWRLLECLIVTFGVILASPIVVPLLTMCLYARGLTAILRKLNISQFDFEQWLRGLWLIQAAVSVVEPIMDTVRIMRDFCRRRSLQLRVSTGEPVARIDMPYVLQYMPMQQPSSNLLTKLPQELRDEIYKQYLLLDGPGLRIEVAWRTEGRRSVSVLHAEPFSFGPFRPQICDNCPTERHKRHCDALNHVHVAKEDRGRGKLAMLRSCRLVYTQMIRLLYSEFLPPLR